ncbi:cell cycle checkpoint protein RAD17 [Biscogniauxia marginata]|nr:cell cycle checkpoint protein RAD17 [Biscogniauxia marginata]
MASILSYVPVVNRFISSNDTSRSIDIPPVEVHNVETAPEKRPRTLKHLLRANHVNHSIIYHDLEFHNHMPHALSSAYLLGADDRQLHKIYDVEAETLEPWKPSPAEITQDDWRDFLGDGNYQRAYVDFFEDALVMKHNYNWKKVVEEYMFSGKEPLVNSLISGLGHPLIHLGYAFEMDNKEVAIEALGMAATQYDFFHKYIDDPSYSKPSSFKSTSPLEILGKMAKDERLKGLFKNPSADNLDLLFEKHEDLVMEYWNAWTFEDPIKQFQDSQEAAVAVLVATVPPGTHSYNFFIVHLLTTSHAVRILLPVIPSKFHISLVRQWWLLTVAVYAAELCPKIDPDYIKPEDVAGKQWNYVEDKVINGSYATDAHFVKAIRAIKEAARTWGDVHEHYLAAAVRFVDDFQVCLCVMAPPVKRRRRNIVHASDDEEEPKPQINTLKNYLFSSPESKNASTASSPRALDTSPSPVRKSSRLVASQPSKPAAKPTAKSLRPQSFNGSIHNNGFKSASTSPEKRRNRPAVKSKHEEKGKTADLVTLFSRQAERVVTRPSTKLEDIISDPISDDDDVGEHKAVTTSRVGQNALKRFREPSIASSGSAVAASQKFIRPSRPPRDPSLDDEQRPWSERFGPVNLDELAVHKKKVADVRRWLEDVIAGRMRQRLLILKGAAGTGKTTTLRLLAKDMRCELLEWRNPTGSLGSQQGFQSASAQFEEFMGRSGKFGQLDTGVEGPARQSQALGGNDDKTQKIILIEEFPNTFIRSSTALTSFRSTILQYLATNTPSLAMFGRQSPRDPITPIVMVISETLLTTTSASADSFTAHRLLGPEIIRHPGTCMIEFNAIAPTLLASALEVIVQKEARKSGRRRTPGPSVLKRLGEIGDIRSAISSLEFLCLKGDLDSDWGSKVTFTKSKRGAKNGVALTKGEVESLQLVSQREASLGIFHAVGKVVYNKRDELPMDRQTPEGRAEILPDYLASYSRPKRSEVSVDSLIDETGTDTHTFISALHENYALSCESTGPSDPNSPLDYINGCIEYLSESDLLCPSWDIFFGGRSFGGSGFTSRDAASHMLRQEEITFQVATRGLLFSLPNPVKRVTTTSRRGGGDAFKMFYPTSLKLWREKEELEGIVDYWASTILKGDETEHNLTDGASAFRRPKASGNEEWISKQRNGNKTKKLDSGQNQPAPLLSLGSSARREMLLERLPYMAHIARRRRSSASTVRLKDMEKVVSFSGIGTAADEETAADADDQAGEFVEAWATDKPTEEPSPRKKNLGIRQNTTASSASALPSVQKLVISDDDIEDD